MSVRGDVRPAGRPRRSAPTGPGAIDWSQPWLEPLRADGERRASAALRHGVVEALNGDPRGAAAGGRLRFVAQNALPPGESYEAFIARTACVPTRDNVHDFFNGLVWRAYPRMKSRLNACQAALLAGAPAARPGVRGAARDALTFFDENGAWWQGPPRLAEALRQRDWQALFIDERAAWQDVRVGLFGHGLIEKLVAPRKAICAHAWLVPEGVDVARFLLDALDEPSRLGEARPHVPLPVLGVPGWWPANQDACFYADTAVFRPPGPRVGAENVGPVL